MLISCRPVAIPDLANVVVLDHRCFGGLWNEAAYRREIDSPNSDLLTVEMTVADVSRLVGIGCLWAILEEAHITILGIDPRYQRLGLGRWLLSHLLQLASDRDLAHATLEVRQSNQAAIALYQAFGFQVAGERRRYYSDGETALILWRHRLQDPAFLHHLQTLQQPLSQNWLNRAILSDTPEPITPPPPTAMPTPE